MAPLALAAAALASPRRLVSGALTPPAARRFSPARCPMCGLGSPRRLHGEYDGYGQDETATAELRLAAPDRGLGPKSHPPCHIPDGCPGEGGVEQVSIGCRAACARGVAGLYAGALLFSAVLVESPARYDRRYRQPPNTTDDTAARWALEHAGQCRHRVSPWSFRVSCFVRALFHGA
eukprot:scaffold896_cov188-Isochrysis_galbana.AAC.1